MQLPHAPLAGSGLPLLTPSNAMPVLAWLHAAELKRRYPSATRHPPSPCTLHWPPQGVYFGGLPSAASMVRSGLAAPSDFRLLLGLAGWAPGQLAAEVAGGVWACAAASRSVIMPSEGARSVCVCGGGEGRRGAAWLLAVNTPTARCCLCAAGGHRAHWTERNQTTKHAHRPSPGPRGAAPESMRRQILGLLARQPYGHHTPRPPH